MRKRREFTAAFKSQLVLQLLSGEKRMAELCREHQLTSQLISNWKQQFLAAAPQVFQKGDNSADQARIAELKRMVGRLAMELEIAKKPRACWMGCGAETGSSHDHAGGLPRKDNP